MTWTVELHPDAAAALVKLARRDRLTAKRLTDALREVAATDDPRSRGKALTGPLAGLWRYRVGDWRIVADLQDERLVILAVDVGHRSQIYR